MDMSVFIIECCGKIVNGVNTTVDVGENQITIENKKLENTVDKNGYPPEVEYTDIAKSILYMK